MQPMPLAFAICTHPTTQMGVRHRQPCLHCSPDAIRRSQALETASLGSSDCIKKVETADRTCNCWLDARQPQQRRAARGRRIGLVREAGRQQVRLRLQAGVACFRRAARQHSVHNGGRVQGTGKGS
jgi:hypothetical protein